IFGGRIMWLSRAVAWTLCVSMALPGVGARAEKQSLPQPLPKTVAVAAFKNGLAFVVRQGAVQLENGTGRITPIPNATLGTLWLAPGEANTSLDEVVAYRYCISSERPIQSIAEVLQANAGKTVTITYSMNMKDYTGEIVGVRDSSRMAAEPAPEGARDAVAPQAKPQYLLLRIDKKLLAFPIGSIANAILPDDTNFQEKFEQQRAALRFKIKGAGEKTDLTMGYLEHGLGWTPSYMISLTDDKTAQITLQAVVMDDAEDLNNSDVFFVVGVPNFAYSNSVADEPSTRSSFVHEGRGKARWRQLPYVLQCNLRADGRRLQGVGCGQRTFVRADRNGAFGSSGRGSVSLFTFRSDARSRRTCNVQRIFECHRL